jgi:ArsR family transcriptional regulator
MPRAKPLPPISADPERAGHVAEVLKAVAHPLRIRIVAILCHREESVTGLADRVGASQAIVSQQLRILRSHGLVSPSRKGGFARYRLVEQHLRELVRCMEKCGAGRRDRAA